MTCGNCGDDGSEAFFAPRKPNIGLCGYMRAGKDTVADYLIREHGYQRMGFADALKEEVARGVGCTPADLLEEPLRTQVRPVLQVWGTEFRRAQDPDYWTEQVRKKIVKEARVGGRRLVFNDVRFANEIALLREYGFVVVKIDMSVDDVVDYMVAQGAPRAVVLERLAHKSEQEWQEGPFDATVPSVRGDIDGLCAGIEAVVQELTR